MSVEWNSKPSRTLTATSEPGVYTAPSSRNPRIVYRITGVGTPFVVCPCPSSQLDRDCWHVAEALRIGGITPPPQRKESEDMATQELTKRESAAVVTLDDLKGMDLPSDGNEDIAPAFPVIKIVQPTSAMPGASKNVGKFFHSDREGTAGAYTEHLDVVVLAKRNTRAMFEDGAEKPSCVSVDGVTPLPGQPLWAKQELTLPGGEAILVPHDEPKVCSFCQFGQWVGNTPPVCKSSMTLLVDRGAEEGGLAQMRLSGKSIKPYKQFIAKYVTSKRLRSFFYNLTMTTAEHSEPGKKWFQLVIEPTPLLAEQVRDYIGVVEAQQGAFAANAAHFDDDDAPMAAPVDEWGDGSESYATNTPTHSTLSEPAPLT